MAGLAEVTTAGLARERVESPRGRDALRELLKACPAITGVTFRVHGESGVNEGSYNFWKTVFDGVVTCAKLQQISNAIITPQLNPPLVKFEAKGRMKNTKSKVSQTI